MSAPAPESQARRGDRPYHLLRAAQALFQRDLGGLDPDQRGRAERLAAQTLAVEDLILSAPEAGACVIGTPAVDRALAEVIGQFPSPQAYAAELAGTGLDENGLRRALARQLRAQAVLDRVAADCPAVSEADLRLYYELHRDRFSRPERRTARHLLITVNEEFAESTEGAARARIDDLVRRLRGRANRFGPLARRHSECPSALAEGRLGTVARGQLYPELDAALFRLRPGEISGVVSSELGFHLLLCEKIHPWQPVPFARVRAGIQARLDERQRYECQRRWVAGLPERPAVGPGQGGAPAERSDGRGPSLPWSAA